MPDAYPRFLLPRVKEALGDSPAVLIHGSRQVGKTTLVKSFEQDGYAYISFNDEAQRTWAQEDPKGFAADLPSRTILDEVQRVPELFLSLKYTIDQNPSQMGRLLLTSSASLLHPSLPGSELAGRVSLLQLYPLSRLEQQNSQQKFLSALFDRTFKSRSPGRRLGKELAELLVAGGYPAALKRSSPTKCRSWYRDYACQKKTDADKLPEALQDVPRLKRIHRKNELQQLFELAAACTAQPVNVSHIAKQMQITAPTARTYLDLLSEVFLLEELAPWHSNRVKGLSRTARLQMSDTGVACTLLGLDADTLWQDRKLYGHMVETFVYQEIKKQCSWYEDSVDFCHYRDNRKMEVCLVLKKSRRLYGLKIRPGSTIHPSDLKSLRTFKKAAGKSFEMGVILYDGDQVLSVSPDRDIMAVPISLLIEDS